MWNFTKINNRETAHWILEYSLSQARRLSAHGRTPRKPRASRLLPVPWPLSRVQKLQVCAKVTRSSYYKPHLCGRSRRSPNLVIANDMEQRAYLLPKTLPTLSSPFPDNHLSLFLVWECLYWRVCKHTASNHCSYLRIRLSWAWWVLSLNHIYTDDTCVHYAYIHTHIYVNVYIQKPSKSYSNMHRDIPQATDPAEIFSKRHTHGNEGKAPGPFSPLCSNSRGWPLLLASLPPGGTAWVYESINTHL